MELLEVYYVAEIFSCLNCLLVQLERTEYSATHSLEPSSLCQQNFVYIVRIIFVHFLLLLPDSLIKNKMMKHSLEKFQN